MDTILPNGPKLEEMLQQAPNAPVMLPSHVDAWAQTSPLPSPDPDTAIFLHGPDRGVSEIQVCWRADLFTGEMSDPERAIDIVSRCPPKSSECISVSMRVLRVWLEGKDDGIDREDNDLEGGRGSESSQGESDLTWRSVLCWRGPDESLLIDDPWQMRNLRPGDTIVVPAELGGWDAFGHLPQDSEGRKLPDLGDRAHLQSRAKAILRIHPNLMKWWPESARTLFAKIMGQTGDIEGRNEDESELQKALEELSQLEMTPEWTWLRDTASALARDRHRTRLPHTSDGFVLQGSRHIMEYMSSASTLTSEDDSYSATVRVTLEDHLVGVEAWAGHFGDGIGLPDKLVEDLSLAARVHDVGKADPRFQALLHGGNPWVAQVSSSLLAKSDKLATSRIEFHRARREARYPVGGRHELLSVRLIESLPELLSLAHDQDLVLHLVASHHGYCRPFAPMVLDSAPVQVDGTILGHQMSARSETKLERIDSGVPERFWRLVRRYGWWGLAWLEALMRLADHRCSEAEANLHEHRMNAEVGT